MTQSQRQVVISPVCQRGVHRIVSRYRLPTPEGLLGAQKVAVAEWKTDIFTMSSVVEQRWSGGVPVNVGFCS